MRFCVYLSEHGRSLRSMQKSVEVDGQRLQGLIDGNKRWLEMRKKDTSMYPSITHTHTHPLTLNTFHIIYHLHLNISRALEISILSGWESKKLSVFIL